MSQDEIEEVSPMLMPMETQRMLFAEFSGSGWAYGALIGGAIGAVIGIVVKMFK
jgi:hypothetical protein